ncbi:3-oxoacyl-[acyl-carrier protein] reductase [Sulfuriferula multivorans]|uniref:3-oxoacyl-[acyl-carrier protein] reductase n=1 Tax=Sulfuriferula multivorans TaxID=1559896 RepID=A0A401J9W9_9PROT|nr:glucose 1-dehydrogenase [Sulfuriferula multivorans]GBL44346.1 3-oxoacyl-[acyl-carrier protein] reductase [Sulfuriferula multivorans]
MMTIDLSGRRALVTGSSSGLGEAIAMALSSAGAKVAINYRNDKVVADAVVARIVRQGGAAQAFQADISVPEQVTRLFAEVGAAFGGLDILVNNAGIDGGAANCADSDPDQWARVIAVDLQGSYYCARQALHWMLPQKRGVIINITSVHEFIPWSGYSAYTSAKAGLSMFTKTLAQEVAASGVRVLAIAPGAIKTPINASVWEDPQGLVDLDQKIAMGRMGEPDEIGQVAAFLASDLASYITGTSIAVDGGMLIYPDFRHGG